MPLDDRSTTLTEGQKDFLNQLGTIKGLTPDQREKLFTEYNRFTLATYVVNDGTKHIIETQDHAGNTKEACEDFRNNMVFVNDITFPSPQIIAGSGQQVTQSVLDGLDVLYRYTIPFRIATNPDSNHNLNNSNHICKPIQ